MKRKFYRLLQAWKENQFAKPMLVIGVRQVGKTHLIKNFCRANFADFIYLDLNSQSEWVQFFDQKINFDEKMRQMQIRLNRDIIPGRTVIFIDEIQESEGAIAMFKPAFEQPVPYRIIGAGSLLGVKLGRMHESFPVGKVALHQMYPLDFEEFLWALDKKRWADEIRTCWASGSECLLHQQLWRLYTEFMCIGGLPEMVTNYRANNGNILAVDRSLMTNIVSGYLADMSKFTFNKAESAKIEQVYQALPPMLAREDKKFQYSLIRKNAKRRDFESALDWLTTANLIYVCRRVDLVQTPLSSYTQDGYFQVYLNDIGLLAYLAKLEYYEILSEQKFPYRGALAENCVAAALSAQGKNLYYWHSDNSAEVDFLLNTRDGIIPVEVKAGINTKAKSLQVYMEKYRPAYAYRLSARNFGQRAGIRSVPLYAAFLLGEDNIFFGD